MLLRVVLWALNMVSVATMNALNQCLSGVSQP